MRADLMLPARGVVPAALAFGTVIMGATAQQALPIANALSPLDSLDDLDFTLTSSPDFGVVPPAGSLLEGASLNAVVTLDTSTPGVKAGSATLASDDPDAPSRNVALSGTVLRHAGASLDSLTSVLSTLADFGTQLAGAFTNQEVRVHNLSYDALQVQLALASAVVTGGDDRFSIAGGFTPSLLGTVGSTLELAFDDAAATVDSLYEATLTIGSGDEALPGALAQPDLLVSLRAKVQPSGSTGTTGGAPPTATVLFAPFPNPLLGSANVSFDIAREGNVRVEAFDLSGRRVASLLDASLAAGRYSVRWNGRSSDGTRLGAGLYFIRLSAPGIGPQTARLAIVR